MTLGWLRAKIKEIVGSKVNLDTPLTAPDEKPKQSSAAKKEKKMAIIIPEDEPEMFEEQKIEI